jgi:uncharacterized protein (DUF1684 family)
MNVEAWKRQIERERKQKDQFFKEHWQSPIPEKDRKRFKGLDYFPPDPKYRFELELHEHPKKKIVQIEDTGGNLRNMFRWGEFRFTIDGVECTLQAYKSEANEPMLFIPFKDATSGKETYGAGRYIDLHDPDDRTPDGKWILDFNKAYNPWCAFSWDYVCPYVPPENWLKVPIKAGEKAYKLD